MSDESDLDEIDGRIVESIDFRPITGRALGNGDPLYVAATVPCNLSPYQTVEVLCLGTGFEGYLVAAKHISHAFRTGEGTSLVPSEQAEALGAASRVDLLDTIGLFTEAEDEDEDEHEAEAEGEAATDSH